MTWWIVVAAFALVVGAAVYLVPELAPAAAVTGLIACVAGACVSVWG